ncbi:hypothetical protein B0H14DRAFT_2867809 [Mycena olivaceomarginata]|nr:hypothetical protein B0H14DRAFT_2867809 [Mycena olivaceomarginata]
MASPPAKRQRTEDAPIMRSEIWRNDGSVVLQAANMQFRVHWSVLALHSSVFSDMQGLPQPDDQPTVEGCPVVELPDDPQDIEYLLKALYSTTFHCQKTLPLAVVGAFIRLGRKYDFKDLFDSAVGRLTSQWPMTLAEYDTRAGGSIASYPGWRCDVIALASENNIMSILPHVYYRLVRSNTLATEQWLFLPPADLRRCVVGRENLLLKQLQPEYTLGWLQNWIFNDCDDSEWCRTVQESLLKVFLDDNAIRALEAPPSTLPNFCAACTRRIIESMDAGRKKIWEELPGFFELPPWSELKNDM